MTPIQHARVILDAVSLLHQAGHGRLRVRCYVKEGLGAWRHQLFAADRFELEPGPSTGLASLPGWPVAEGDTPEAIADNLKLRWPELLEAARGPADAYAHWLRRILDQDPHGVFEMEDSGEARIGRLTLTTPFGPEHGPGRRT